MRFSDGPTTEATVEVASDVRTVWDVVTDPAMPARFSSELAGVEWLDGATGPELGARFRGSNRHDLAGEWQMDCVITAFDVDRRFEWTVGDPADPTATWRFELDPTAPDRTTLSQHVRLGPGPSKLTEIIASMPDAEEHVIDRRLAEHRENMRRTLEGARALVEGGDRA